MKRNLLLVAWGFFPLVVFTGCAGQLGTTLTAHPDPFTSNPVAHFEFTSTNGKGFLCRLNEGKQFKCKSPLDLQIENDGTHQFEVAAYGDDAVDREPGTFTWVLDRAAPDAPTITTPSRLPYTSSDTMLAIRGDCETDATVNVGENGTVLTAAPCLDSHYSAVVAKFLDGSYSFDVFQIDRAGNNSAAMVLDWTRNTTNSPIVSSVTPNNGSVSGGTQITINGNNFESSGATVTVAGKPCANLSAPSANTLRCTTPASLVPGLADVTVTNSGGFSGTGAGYYAYTGAATYSMLKDMVFTQNCMACHNISDASGGLDLFSYQSVAARTSPGNAAQSLLYLRITTQSPIMPKGAPPLHDDEKKAIADWINAGSMNN